MRKLLKCEMKCPRNTIRISKGDTVNKMPIRIRIGIFFWTLVVGTRWFPARILYDSWTHFQILKQQVDWMQNGLRCGAHLSVCALVTILLGQVAVADFSGLLQIFIGIGAELLNAESHFLNNKKISLWQREEQFFRKDMLFEKMENSSSSVKECFLFSLFRNSFWGIEQLIKFISLLYD